MMRIKIFVFLLILVAAGNATVSGAEQDCPMLEARHITSLRVTFTGFGDRDQYGNPMQINGTWDLPFTKHYPNSACDWSTKTSSGHRVSLTVFDVLHPDGGKFMLSISASTGGVQAMGTKPLSDVPYGNWLMKPVSIVIAGTAQVSDAAGGKPEQLAARYQLYVAADVANLRREPSSESQPFIRLRINSPVEVVEKNTPWLKVRAGGFVGWIREEFTVNQPITIEETGKRAKESSGAERLRWLERTVALDPAHKAAWTELRNAYAAAGKKDAAKAVDRLLSGREPFYFAECHNGNAELRVAYALKGGFVKLGEEKHGSHNWDVLDAFANEVTAWPWYAITPTSAEIIPGTPFPRPEMDSQSDTVRLGPCPAELQDEQIMSTAPFIPVQLKHKKDGSYVFADGSGLKLQKRTEKKGESWTLLGRDGKPLRKRDGSAAIWRSTESASCPAGSFAPGAWYRNRLSGVIYGTIDYEWSCCGGEGDGECGSESSEWLTIIFPAEGVLESVYNLKGGC